MKSDNIFEVNKLIYVLAVVALVVVALDINVWRVAA